MRLGAEVKTVFIGKDIIHATDMDADPKVGGLYNFRTSTDCGLETGQYKVTEIASFQWGEKSYPRITVTRLGDLSDILPIHEVSMMNY